MIDVFSLFCILLSQISLQPYLSFSIRFGFFYFFFDGPNLLELFNIRYPLWRTQLYRAILTLWLKFITHSQILPKATHLEAYMHYLWFWSNSVMVKIFKGCFPKGINIAPVKVKQAVPLGISLQALNKILLNSWDVNVPIFSVNVSLFAFFLLQWVEELASWSGSSRITAVFLSAFWDVSWKPEV